VPLQNRVTPLGELIADPARGLVYGNRGCLHDAGGRIRRTFGVRRWIACRLEFRGWQRGPKMQPGRFTELFFLDDATALAAGHRPCALCRREDYNRLLAVWGRLHPGDHGADAIDLRLHHERLGGRERRLHTAAYDGLPDGAYVMAEGAPWLVWGDGLLRWSASGYHHRAPRPRTGGAMFLTPPSLVELLRDGRTGLVPLVHPSQRSAACDTLSG
jgi:hypothetical protein